MLVSKYPEGSVSFTLTPKGAEFEMALVARGWQAPGSSLTVDELHATGITGRQELLFTDLEGKLYGGTLKGNARLRWSPQWSLSGAFRLRDAQAGSIATALTGPLVHDGSAEASGSFAMQAPSAEDMFGAPRIESAFILRNGSLAVDLAKAAATREAVQGGATAFSELAGHLVAAGGQVVVKQLKLTADALNATGTLEIDANRAISGRLAVEPRAPGISRGALALSGTSASPSVAPAK